MQPNTNSSSTTRPQHVDRIEEDTKTLAAKKTIMKGWKVNAMLNSVSKVSAFVAGPLFAAGLIQAATTVFGAASFTAGVAAVAAAPITLGILAVGAAFAALAVASDYIATRKGQSTYFDNQEAISQSTGRNLVKEMEAHKLCITNAPENQANQRSDGKTWTQTVVEQQTQQAAR